MIPSKEDCVKQVGTKTHQKRFAKYRLRKQTVTNTGKQQRGKRYSGNLDYTKNDDEHVKQTIVAKYRLRYKTMMTT